MRAGRLQADVSSARVATAHRDFGAIYKNLSPETKLSTVQKVSSERVYHWSEISQFFSTLQNPALKKPFPAFVCLVRHGETEYNRQDLISGRANCPLNQTGRAQAWRLRNLVSPATDVVFASDLTRAIETAKIVADHIPRSPKVYVDARLSEVSMGKLEGTKRRWITEFAEGDLDYAVDGGETHREAARRSISAVIDLLKFCSKRGYKHPLVVTHNGIIRILRSLLLDVADGKLLFEWSANNIDLVNLKTDQMRLGSIWKMNSTR